MKTRIGFVSNSSSCSFCIVGQYYSWEELTKEIEEKLSSAGLNCNGQPDSEKCVGLDINKIKDMNLTYSEFKKVVEQKLKSVGLNADHVDIQTDGWYDG